MERDSFIFYKSFYEAIKPLSKDIQVEIYTAIMEYALYGNLSESLKPVANSVFTLVKPILDTNKTRYSSGRRGGRPTKPADTAPVQSYEQEVELMKADTDLRKSVCTDFSISETEYTERLSRFLRHCNDEKKTRGKACHDSLADAKKHLRYWMSKAFPAQPPLLDIPAENTPQDYGFSGGFGGMDN
mgnify:CR=1 FL=1